MITLQSRHAITLDTFREVSRAGLGVVLGDQAMARMTAARASFMRLLEDPTVTIYGVTSGYGQLARLRLDPAARARHAARPPLANAVVFGPPLPERVVRGIVLARLANYLEGHAAITPAVAAEVAAMLDGRPLPELPADGHGGAGEILALGTLFADLAQRLTMAEKDVLSLINGSPCAAALTADAALCASVRIERAGATFALAAEAFRAPLEAYDAALDEFWGDPHEARALARLRELLTGATPERRPYQAPVSFRILPRVLGHAYRALEEATGAASAGLAAITDNPVYLLPDADHPNGRVLSNGGYHNARTYPAMDGLAGVYADLALLAERQGAKILEGRVSGLPDQLRSDAMSDDRYLGCIGMVAVGYGEKARHAAQRTFLPGPESGGFAQNDVAQPNFIAWGRQREAGSAVDAALATLAVIASQALYVTGRPAPPALMSHLQWIRDHVPPVEKARRLGSQIGALANALTVAAETA